MTTINLDYQPNAAYYGDCEEIIQAWKEQGVQGLIDLIYLDPPFNSNRNYGAPTSKSKKNDTGSMDAFVDMWTYDQPARDRVDRICNQQKLHPARLLIKSLKPYLEKHDSGMLAYLAYMADRLRLFKGLLRDTGSIYLHCDPFANYYLRLLMDAIFGAKNFRNEIIWKRTVSDQKGSQHAPRQWGNNTDTILFYTKSDKYKLQPYRPLTEEEIEAKFNKTDENGRKYRDDSSSLLRARSMGPRPNLCYEWKGFRNPSPAGWRLCKERLEEEFQKGNIVIREDGKLERRQYQEDYPGYKPGSLWPDIKPATGKERVEGSYPTQKPLGLLDRIIKASTNEGDLVLDPFCGCGTAMHSAVNNHRRFIGIDISVFTIHEVARKRLQRECGLDVPIYGIPTNFDGAQLLAEQDKFKFEAWAAETLTFGDIGIISNKIKRGDGGVDGSGLLYGYTEDGEDKVIVQVKGGQFTPNDVRAFRSIIDSNPEVAAGIFITLDGDNPKAPNGFRWTRGMEREALNCGTFKMGGGKKRFRRMQHWSVRDRFYGEKGVYPEMPIMINPFNDKPMLEIGSTVPNKPIMKPSKPAKRNRRRNGKTKPDLF